MPLTLTDSDLAAALDRLLAEALPAERLEQMAAERMDTVLDFITPEQLANRMNITKLTALRLARREKFRKVTIRGILGYRLSDVAKLIEDHTSEKPTAPQRTPAQLGRRKCSVEIFQPEVAPDGAAPLKKNQPARSGASSAPSRPAAA